MTGAHDILMPQLGQAMTRGQVVEWLAQTGERVNAGTHLLTIESDKFTYEIEAPASGILERLAEVGAEAEVGTVLGRIGETLQIGVGSEREMRSPEASMPTSAAPRNAPPRIDGAQASPKAKAVAMGRIDLSEVAPSRPDGLIVASDVQLALAEKSSRTPSSGGAMARLQRSWQQAPHFVQMVDVDAGVLVEAQALRRAGGFPGTLNDILIHAAAQVLSEFPAINSRVVGGELVTNASIDISLAVATERGLRTPAVRDAGGKSLAWVSDQSRRAIDAAKAGEAPGGPASLTISNLGAHGVRQGTPVLNLDEAVLVFAGAIIERPVARNGGVIVRPQMTLSIAYDHRVVDGLEAARFTAALREALERFDLSPWRRPVAVDATPARLVTLRSERTLRCDLAAGPHRWTIDEPPAVGGEDAAPDPVLHMMGALLSCLTIAFKVVAARRRLPVERIAADISATPAAGKVKRIDIHLSVWSSADPAAVSGLLKAAKAACYVHELLRADLDLTVELSLQQSEVAS